LPTDQAPQVQMRFENPTNLDIMFVYSGNQDDTKNFAANPRPKDIFITLVDSKLANAVCYHPHNCFTKAAHKRLHVIVVLRPKVRPRSSARSPPLRQADRRRGRVYVCAKTQKEYKNDTVYYKCSDLIRG